MIEEKNNQQPFDLAKRVPPLDNYFTFSFDKISKHIDIKKAMLGEIKQQPFGMAKKGPLLHNCSIFLFDRVKFSSVEENNTIENLILFRIIQNCPSH